MILDFVTDNTNLEQYCLCVGTFIYCIIDLCIQEISSRRDGTQKQAGTEMWLWFNSKIRVSHTHANCFFRLRRNRYYCHSGSLQHRTWRQRKNKNKETATINYFPTHSLTVNWRDYSTDARSNLCLFKSVPRTFLYWCITLIPPYSHFHSHSSHTEKWSIHPTALLVSSKNTQIHVNIY